MKNAQATPQKLDAFISFLRDCECADLLPESSVSFWKGKYNAADMLWIIDHISEITPIIDVLRLYVKGSNKNIKLFFKKIKSQTCRGWNSHIASEPNRRIARFVTQAQENFEIKYPERMNEEFVPAININLHEPRKTLLVEMANAIRDNKLSYTISNIEFAYDIFTTEVEFTFEALCRWIIKKNTNSTSRCFTDKNKNEIRWAVWNNHNDIKGIPSTATLYLDKRGSRSWIKMYIKENDGPRRIRIEFTSSRQYLRESLKIDTFEDLDKYSFLDIAKNFCFVEFDLSKYIQAKIRFLERRNSKSNGTRTTIKNQNLIMEYVRIRHENLYMYHSLQAAILAKTRVPACPLSCRKRSECKLNNHDITSCPPLTVRNNGPEIKASIAPLNKFDDFFRKCIEGIPVLR